MRATSYVTVFLAGLLVATATAKNHWQDLSYEQLDATVGKVEALCLDPADRLYAFVTHTDAENRVYLPAILSRGKGGCWNEPDFILSDSGQAIHSSRIVVSPVDSSIHILFTMYSQAWWTAPLYMASTSQGTWLIRKVDPAFGGTLYNGGNRYHDLAIDSLGHLHAIWVRRLTTSPAPIQTELVYATDLEGSWTESIVSSSTPGLFHDCPNISVTPGGRAVIAFRYSNLVYTQINDLPGSDNWRVDSTDLLGSSQWTSKTIADLRVDKLGAVHLIYTGVECPIECEPYWVYYVTKYLSDTTWTGSQLLSDIAVLPQLEIDRDLNMHVLYRFVAGYMSSGDMGYAYFDGSAWVTDTLIDAVYPDNWPEEFAFGIDSRGFPHLLYTGEGSICRYGRVHYEDITLGDIVYLVNYIFNHGEEPCDFVESDVDCSGFLNITDAVRMMNYIFGGGPEPCALE